MAKAKKEKVNPLPQAGGSFIRNPDSGLLTKKEAPKVASDNQKDIK